MGLNLQNVFRQPCEILLAKRTDDTTETNHSDANGGGAQQIWFHAGTINAGSGKFTKGESAFESQIGSHKISSTLGIEGVGIEVDDTAVDTLEALEGSVCDAILQPVQAVDGVSSDRIKLLAIRPRLLIDGAFAGNGLLGVKFLADGVYKSVDEFMKRIQIDWVLAPGGASLAWPYSSHIYIAARTVPGTPVDHATSTGWVDIGAHKAGNAKVTASENTVDTTRGKLVISKKLGLAATALETDDTKIAALVAKEGQICDVLLAPVNSSSNARMKFLAVIPRLGVEGAYDGSDVPGVSFEADGVYSKLSNFMMRTTATWTL